jgi:hypothetical protein
LRRLVITDSVGKPLFHLRNKVISIHKTFVAEDDGGNEIFRVTKRMSCEWLGRLPPACIPPGVSCLSSLPEHPNVSLSQRCPLLLHPDRVTPSTSLNSTSHAHRHPRRYHSRATVFPAAAQDPRHHASRASSQLTSPVGTKMQATFRNHSTGQEVTLELRGDMWGGSADISMGGVPVAQITRQLFNMREVFADKQTVSRCGGRVGPCLRRLKV